MTREFITDSDQGTLDLGRDIAVRIASPLVVLLTGNLGTGKTTLAKGIISGVGAASPAEVTSPTFTLVHQYGSKPKVYHVDLYRVDPGRDMETLGLEDLWNQNAVVLIEWGEKLGPFPGPHWKVHLEDLGGDRRKITVEDA